MTWKVMLTVGSSTDSGGNASGNAGSHRVSEIFKPSIPDRWNSYGFRIVYRGSVLAFAVDKDSVEVKTLSGNPVSIVLYDQTFTIGEDGVKLPLQ